MLCRPKLFFLVTVAGMLLTQCQYRGATETVQYRADSPVEAVMVFWDAAVAGSEERALGIVSPPSESFLRICGKKKPAKDEQLPYTFIVTEHSEHDPEVSSPAREPTTKLSKKDLDDSLNSDFSFKRSTRPRWTEHEVVETSVFENEAVVTIQPRFSKSQHFARYYYLLMSEDGWKVIAVEHDSTRFLLFNPGYGTPQSCRE